MAAATVSLSQALDTLKSMFPEKDRDLIEYVLRQHRGEMEATAEALLQMQETSLPPGVSVGSQRRRRGSQKVVVPGSEKQWRQVLPADFLKIPGTIPVLAADVRQSHQSVSRQPQQPMVADPGALSDRELEALFQDENFVRAIQDDPELRQYIQAEQAFFQHRAQGATPSQGTRQQGHNQTPSGTPVQQQGSNSSGWKSFKAGLSSMGAGISSKFNSIARNFNKGGQGSASDAQYSSLLASESPTDTGIELDTLDGDSPAPGASQRAGAPATSTQQGQQGQNSSAPAFAIGGAEDDEDDVGEQGSFLGSDHLAGREQPK